MTGAEWESALNARIARGGYDWIARAVVVEECGSTQDEAHRLAAGRPGLIVVALHQTGGRGRMGREWVQGGDRGLAVTFALDAARFAGPLISVRVGLAAAGACEEASGCPRLGVKWPNDVVTLDGRSQERKLGGVLIEARTGVLLVGVGINVNQCATDWPEALRQRAVSLQQLTGAAAVRRENVLNALIGRLDVLLKAPEAAVREQFESRDALRGTRREFRHGNRTYTGVVERIDPARSITLRTDEGESVRLEAAGAMLGESSADS
jgi:BirA family transcriptional regulator, biotin operon repressor / biotin---[acetyl-CoA-carboxylase] ligase